MKQSRDVIKKSVLKIIVISIIVGLNWTGLLAVGKTLAYFFDNEDSNANNFTASILDFSLRSGQSNFVPLETASNMKPGDSVARDIYIKKEGSLPFKYTASSEPVDGLCDLELYDALQLKIWYNWYEAEPGPPPDHLQYRHMDLKYDGLLKDFDLRALDPNDPDLQIPNTHPYFDNLFYGQDEHWFYASQIILPAAVSAELQNKSCQFKFIFDGWQINLPDSSSGFSDQEEILSTIATGDWMPDVTVIYPNGGEVWYLVPDWCPNCEWCSLWCQDHGMNEDCEYPLEWTATNQIGPDMDLLIDIYFSADSSASWMAQIVDDTDNDGVYWWKPPYDMSYVTDQGRIKVEATHKDYPFLTNWDMSDADFCPPLLTLEDLLNWEETPVEEEPITEEEPAVEEGPTDEEIPTTEEEIPSGETTEEITEEISEDSTEEITEEITEDVVDEGVEEEPIVEEPPIIEEGPVVEEEPPVEEVATEEGGIIEEINEMIDEVIEEIVDEIMPDEETGDELVSEPEVPEAPTIEDVPIIEEAPANETPAVEEQPAAVPDDSSSTPDGAGESVSDGGSGDGGGETGVNSDGGSPAEGAGESSGE